MQISTRPRTVKKNHAFNGLVTYTTILYQVTYTTFLYQVNNICNTSHLVKTTRIPKVTR